MGTRVEGMFGEAVDRIGGQPISARRARKAPIRHLDPTLLLVTLILTAYGAITAVDQLDLPECRVRLRRAGRRERSVRRRSRDVSRTQPRSRNRAKATRRLSRKHAHREGHPCVRKREQRHDRKCDKSMQRVFHADERWSCGLDETLELFESGVVRSDITTNFGAASGVAAFEDDRMVGFLIGSLRFEEPWGRSAWVESAGHAVAPDRTLDGERRRLVGAFRDDGRVLQVAAGHRVLHRQTIEQVGQRLPVRVARGLAAPGAGL